MAFDVEGRIGLGVAEPLRVLEALGERQLLLLHAGEDVIAGAVEDAVDARERVADQAFAQRLDDRDAAGDRGLEIERHVMLLGERGKRHAVARQQGLVGGDDRFAGRERRLDRAPWPDRPRRPSARRTRRSPGSVASVTGSATQRRRSRSMPRSRGGRAGAYRHDLDRAAAARRERLALALDQAHDRGADRAESGKTHFQRRRHATSGNRVETPLSGGSRGAPRCATFPAPIQGSGGCCGRPGGCAARSRPGRCARSPRRARRTPRRARPRPPPSRPAAWRTPGCRALRNMLRHRRPGEHRGRRRRNRPAGAAEAVDQGVAAAPIGVAHLADAILRSVERGGGGDLDRREGAVVEIGFHPRQRRDDALVADREAHAPARHREGLRHRGELDRDVDRARHLQHRGRRIAVEIDLRIGEVGQDEDAVLLREQDEVAIEIEVGHIGGRVGRIADHHRDRLRDRVRASRARAPRRTAASAPTAPSGSRRPPSGSRRHGSGSSDWAR